MRGADGWLPSCAGNPKDLNVWRCAAARQSRDSNIRPRSRVAAMAAEFTKQQRLNPNRSLGRSIVGRLGFNSYDSNMLANYGQTTLRGTGGIGTWLDSRKATKKQTRIDANAH